MSDQKVIESAVLAALGTVNDPELGRDLVSLGMVKDLNIKGGSVEFSLVLTTPACPLKGEIERAAREAVLSVPGVKEVGIQMSSNVVSRSAGLEKEPVPGVKNIIAVGSGKGGVGKSTVSVNLAISLAQAGAKVGLLDADITGPNIPEMMGISETPETAGERLLPLEQHGIKLMSIGFLVPEGSPVVWRAPLMNRMLKQFLYDVEWGELDYLIIDLPPGTGDIVLTLVQSTPLAGAVIVTTPQDVALLDATRGLAMFQKMGTPILGIVENMSFFVCPHCSERTEIFNHGGGREIAELSGINFLGEIPLDLSIRVGGDEGLPVTLMEPNSPQAEAFYKVGEMVAAKISVLNLTDEPAPAMEVSTQ